MCILSVLGGLRVRKAEEVRHHLQPANLRPRPFTEGYLQPSRGRAPVLLMGKQVASACGLQLAGGCHSPAFPAFASLASGAGAMVASLGGWKMHISSRKRTAKVVGVEADGDKAAVGHFSFALLMRGRGRSQCRH